MTSGVHVLEQPTLVLNKHWIPVHLTTARHALTLLYQQGFQSQPGSFA